MLPHHISLPTITPFPTITILPPTVIVVKPPGKCPQPWWSYLYISTRQLPYLCHKSTEAVALGPKTYGWAYLAGEPGLIRITNMVLWECRWDRSVAEGAGRQGGARALWGGVGALVNKCQQRGKHCNHYSRDAR